MINVKKPFELIVNIDTKKATGSYKVTANKGDN